jgi:hypothetical protein
MAKKEKQDSDQDKQRNTGAKNEEGKNLPVPKEPAKTLKESVDIADVDPEEIAKSVPYEDSGYSEAVLLDDGI